MGGIRVWDPDSNNIINELFVEQEAGTVSWYKQFFMYTIVYGCIWWCWGCTHCGTIQLVKGHVSKGEDVLCHDKSEASTYGIEWVVVVDVTLVSCQVFAQ